MNSENLVRASAISPFTSAVISNHLVDVLGNINCSLTDYEKSLLNRYSRGRIHAEARRIARKLDAE